MSEPRNTLPGFQEHAEALGYLVVRWGELEEAVDSLILHLTEDRLQVPIILGCSGLLDKLKMARALGFVFGIRLQGIKPDHDFFELLTKSMRHIKSNLAERRNRLIHDRWLAGGQGSEGRASRILKAPQIPEVQKGKKRSMTLGTVILVTVDEIWKLNDDIQQETQYVHALSGIVCAGSDHGIIDVLSDLLRGRKK